jgi:hypothetical protein
MLIKDIHDEQQSNPKFAKEVTSLQNLAAIKITTNLKVMKKQIVELIVPLNHEHH